VEVESYEARYEDLHRRGWKEQVAINVPWYISEWEGKSRIDIDSICLATLRALKAYALLRNVPEAATSNPLLRNSG
jgi:hypothetical protein